MSIESREFHTNEEGKEILSQEEKDLIKYCIEDLRSPTQKILKQLHNQIEKGEYTIIIGDDTSGRIPTLIVGGVVKELYNKKNFPSPLVRFIAGNVLDRKGMTSEFNEFAEKLKDESEERFGSDHTQKVLIVTEFMDTGMTLEQFIMNFKAKGMPCDVATIGSEKNIFQRFHFGRRMGSKIMRGQKKAPKILRSRKAEITGVAKDYKHLFSESFRKDPFFGERIGYESNEKVQAIINEARENAKTLTRDLVIWYNETYKRSESEK